MQSNQSNPNFRVKGALFENDRQSGPAFSGFVEIDGVRTNIVLWPKTSQKGVNYFQVSEDKKQKTNFQPGGGKPFPAPQGPKIQYTQPTTGRNSDMDDDIPF